MGVAALSTSAIALTAGSVPLTAAPQTPDAPMAFAQLVAQAKSGEKGASQGNGTESSGEGESEPTGVVDEMLSTVPTDETKEAAIEQPVNLLAEIEAMAAAAAQLTVTQPAPVQPVNTVPVAAPVADTPAAQSIAATKTAAVIINIPSPAARAGVAQPALAQPLADTPVTRAPVVADPAAAPVIDGKAPTPQADVAAPTTDSATVNSAPKSIPSDIASLLASLKAAFAPVDKKTAEAGNIPAALAAQTSPAQAPAEASPLPAAPAVATAPLPAATPIPAPANPAAPAEAAAQTVTAAAVETVAAAIVKPQEGSKPAAKAPADTLVADAQPAPAAPTAHAATETKPAKDELVAPQRDSAASVSAETSAPAPAATAAAPAPTVAPQAVAQPAQAATPIDAALAADGSAPVNQADQVVTRHLDLARDNQWLDQLARDISQASTRDGHLKFQLNPERLGALTVEIANSAAGTAIRMTAETDQTRAIIADAQPRLLAEVRAQGLRVSESHVDLNNQNNSGGYGSGSANGQQGQPGQQRQSPSADHQPFARKQATSRDDVADSAARDDSDLYA